MNTPNTSAPETAAARPGVTVLKRIFRMGSMELPDLAPHLDAADSLKLYESSRPILKTSTLGECFEEGGLLVYPVEKPPVQTKGAR
jgi:hypothetical protein